MPSNAVGNAAETASAPDYNQSIFDFVGNHPVSGGTKWGSGMAAAAVGAGASLLGGILGNKSQDKANKANEAANKEALALQREEMEAKKAADAQHQRQIAPLLAMRYSLLAKYGAKIPTAQGQPNYMPTVPSGTQPPPIMGGGPPDGPPAEVMAQGPQGPPGMTPRLRLEDLPNWSRNAWGA